MNYGVVLENGPENWQILQQTDGFASISLSGRCSVSPERKGESFRVYARVVEESTGIPVLDWQRAEVSRDTFAVTLSSVPAGGLYRIETCLPCSGNGWSTEWAVRGDMRHHIGVGDLFVIAGQSNAKGFGREPAADEPELGVHLLRQNGKWDLASHPLGDSTDVVWESAQDHTVPGYSPYLRFAKTLKRALHYPIGLIQTSKGGSHLAQWNPQESGELYQGMLDFIRRAGGKIRGILWYQGCSDCCPERQEDYLERFSQLVAELRGELGEEIPFLTCQLNRHTESSTDDSWGKIRQAQLEAALSLKQVYVVPTTDLGLSDPIHNSSGGSILLGERLARTALDVLYHRGSFYRAPYLKRAFQRGKTTLALVFANVSGTLDTLGQKPDILICEKGRMLPVYSCTVEEEKLLLETDPFSAENTRVHILHRAHPAGFPFQDKGTGLPCLSSYGIPVEKEREE